MIEFAYCFASIVIQIQGCDPTSLKFVNDSGGHYRPYEITGHCEDSSILCSGLCLPNADPDKPFCACADENGLVVPCASGNIFKAPRGDVKPASTSTPAGAYLQLLSVTPFSATVRCAGPLLRHPIVMPYVHVEEVDSLVPRSDEMRIRRTVRVANKSLPFTIDGLNPATTYALGVRNRVTRASRTLRVVTPPPPLAVDRLPIVALPHAPSTVSWHRQGVHLFSPNAWELLVRKEYILLLISKKKYTVSEPHVINKPVMDIIKKELNQNNFLVVHHYKSKEEFDDDPEMFLGNLPWGDAFTLAMAQVTQYKGVYHLDFVYSTSFSLPDP